MTLSTKYNPLEVEDKWYKYWMDNQFFKSLPDPDKEPFTITIPPPNVTGVLHMGHMLNNTIQDILTRRARMQGKNACWVPGTDHASIATEAKVVAMLKEKGIDKKDISREEFLKYAWEWKEKYGGIILEQLKKLGASCDWDRTSFTMDEAYSNDVIKVFVDLHEKGNIYRGVRMVNWDPKGKTALSDEEVIHKEVNSKLYHVKYAIEGEPDKWVTIATTRPETILGDTAICVNPNDERYTELVGKRAIVPLVGRSIPIIADEYVDLEFGTGCLKVTPAHDINDYELGIRHKLEVIDILNDDGTLSEKAQLYIGEDRFVVRKKIAKELDDNGQLVKTEDIVNKVGRSERTDAVIEPKLSMQWFMKMEDLSKPALDNVVNGNIKFHPPKFINTYKHWMENIRDWCISRQLWWGHRIPAYYLPNGDYVVAQNLEEAVTKAKKIDSAITSSDLRQDDDVLDTWASSWLWPISVFKGISEPNNKDIKYYYPTNDLVTAPEIMFFWVARMIIAGYEYKGELPFKNVYFTGIVRDEKGRKMSKSLGNSPDPLELIKKHGADGVRTGMLFSAPAGNDLLFDEKLCEQGRNFSNKIWNAFRLTQGWEIDNRLEQPEENKLAIDWLNNRLSEVILEMEDHFSKFRVSDALMTIYKFIWNDFCSWYLEIVKPNYQAPIDPVTLNDTLQLFESTMKLLHPFMPFITEEIYHEINEREEIDAITVAEWPNPSPINKQLLEKVNYAFEVITGIRNVRNAKGLSPKEQLKLVIKTKDKSIFDTTQSLINKLAYVNELTFTTETVENASSFIIKADEFYIPLDGLIDLEKEKEELVKQLEYTKGFMQSVSKKLSNERFVNNAPDQVVAAEKKKMEDAEAKIKVLEESLARM